MVRTVTGTSGGRRVPQGYRDVLVERPEAVVALVSEDVAATRRMAHTARAAAARSMPRISGRTAKRLYPLYAEGVFGIWFPDPHVWFLERGVRPFTMRSLEGKTIPMWIDDPTGKEREKNPRAETRTTEDGRQQVLIFRRAARAGATKQVWKRERGQTRRVTVPRSYPGAPGRIALREADGRIARSNTGVRWRHSGTPPEGYLMDAVVNTARAWGYGTTVIATDRRLTGISDVDSSRARTA